MVANQYIPLLRVCDYVYRRYRTDGLLWDWCSMECSGSCSGFAATFPNQDGELQNFPNAKGIQPLTTNSAYPNDPINRDIFLKGICMENMPRRDKRD